MSRGLQYADLPEINSSLDVDTIFVRAGIEGGREEVLQRVAATLESILARQSQRSRGLSAHDIELLESGGFSRLQSENKDQSLALVHHVAELVGLSADTRSAGDVAAMLGVQSSRIRQKALRGELYGLHENGKWQFPGFQFVDGKPLPYLSAVLAALDSSLSPFSVYRFFTTPQPELVVTDAEVEDPLTPCRWLILGYPPGPVIDSAMAL